MLGGLEYSYFIQLCHAKTNYEDTKSVKKKRIAGETLQLRAITVTRLHYNFKVRFERRLQRSKEKGLVITIQLFTGKGKPH